MIPRVILIKLVEHKQFALATVGDDGRPWVVCLNLTIGPELDIIWESKYDTVHSKNLKDRSDVSICVSSETENFGDFGFYAHATASEVTNKTELEELLKLRYSKKNKPIPPTSEFSGSTPLRLYRAKINQAWTNDDNHIKTAVDLNTLRQLAKQR